MQKKGGVLFFVFTCIILTVFSRGVVFADDIRCVGLHPSDADYAKYGCTGANNQTDPCTGLHPTDPEYKKLNCQGLNPGTEKTIDTNTSTPTFDLNIKFENPLKAQTIQDAIKLFMGVIFRLAIPVIVFFFLWTGLSYIFALGNADKLKKVHNMFLWTVIGTLLVLGAYAITNVIVGTINTFIN